MPACHGMAGVGRSELTAIERMKAAFGLRMSGPTAGPVIFTGRDRTGAWPAANRGIALIVQRVIGYVMRDDIRPDITFGPRQERVDLYKIELGVPADHSALARCDDWSARIAVIHASYPTRARRSGTILRS